MLTNSRKRRFKLVTSSFLEGQRKTTETTEVKTKTEWTKCMFCQNDKLEKIITPTESNKQGTSRNTFQFYDYQFYVIQKQPNSNYR